MLLLNQFAVDQKRIAPLTKDPILSVPLVALQWDVGGLREAALLDGDDVGRERRGRGRRSRFKNRSVPAKPGLDR